MTPDPPKTDRGEPTAEPETTDLPESETPEPDESEPDTGNPDSDAPDDDSHDDDSSPIDPSEESPDLDSSKDPDDPEPSDDSPAMAVAASPQSSPPLTDAEVEAAISRKSRKSFLMGAAAVAATASGILYLNGHAVENNSVPWPLRKVLNTNESVAEAYFKPTRLIAELPASRVTLPARENGDVGLSEDIDPADWSLSVQPTRKGKSGADDWDTFSLDDIKQLPRHEMVTEFHCIEGWTIVQRWAGARFSDFVKAHTMYADPSKLPAFIGIMTPDGEYYVGLDTASAMHPQTLLCYEQNGAPLEQEHGAPLRLVIPVKYGVKNIKRIGSITFTDKRPADYWAEQGYDWYAGF